MADQTTLNTHPHKPFKIMIAKAIISTAQHKANVGVIYDLIRSKYPYYQDSGCAEIFKSSVRFTLTTNELFERVQDNLQESNGSATNVPSESIPAAISAPSIPEAQMQEEHNYYDVFPNLFGQYPFEWQNQELLTLVTFAPGGHVSPEMEQVSSPGSASSTLLEEHHGDEDDEYDEDDATEETEIQSCDHEEVPIETVVPPNRPSTSTYDAIVASEGKIVDAENRRHSDMMTVLERMIGLQEETVSQLAHLHRVFIEVPKQLQKINTSFEALVVQQTQANYWRMTNVPQFNTSQPGSVHAGQFSPHSSDIHSPGPNVTGQVADIAVQVPDDILPLPSVQIQQQTPTKEATKTKQDTHETDQPSLVQCLPTCSHVSLGTSPVREQSLPKSPVAL
ncbi:uncharacterized protein LOC142490795 [Ascaphus truei]|uniref:uncharacterized protein LOC142490795 n=1 Tax=Ascaphus truei TaxID=8439 RepID=UPI003F591556